MTQLLSLDNIVAGYGGNPVLKGVSMTVEEGSVVGMLGRNGVGKTTTLRAITGQLPVDEGNIEFDGKDITNWDPHESYDEQIGLVREDRGIFPDLTVEENLQVPVVDSDNEYPIEELYEVFPRLRERRSAKGNHLSGGEQQMLAIARALRARPQLLLLDEPSEGLAPQIVQSVADVIEEIAESGTTILLVEQNVELTLDLASYIYVMDAGKIVYEGAIDHIRENRNEMESHIQIGQSPTESD